MKAVQKLIECFMPIRDTAPLDQTKGGKTKYQAEDEEIAQQADTITVYTCTSHPKLAALSEKSGIAGELGALTSSEIAALERMPNGHVAHGRQKAPSAAAAPEQPAAAAPSGAAPAPAPPPPLRRRARARTAQEVHNELVLETKLPPQHPALQSCWLQRQIGQGAFSKVYLAVPRDPTEGLPAEAYVLKIVDLGRDCKLRDDYKQILRAESTWLAKFNQPGFVKCFGSWGAVPAQGASEPPEHLVLALENLSGGMLLDRLKKGPMAEHHAAAALYQMLTAIMFMHHMGYVHRDIKPDNVMLSTDWDPIRDADKPPPVKLIDLGMVLNYVENPSASGLMGSPGYMSPEAIRGHRHTPAMDMFSLGVLLFVMLTGCKPLPSAVCTKLSYDQMEAVDYPGLKMPQFKRLSPEAKDLVIALMQRRPQHRPSARTALQHVWLTSNLRLWREHGVEVRYMAITPHAMRHVLIKTPAQDATHSRFRAPRQAAALRSAIVGAAQTVELGSALRDDAAPQQPAAVEPAVWRLAARGQENLPPEATSCDLAAPAGGAPPPAKPPQDASALSDTIRNMLGLLQSGAASDGAARSHRAPPSAEAISTAIHAVADAAKHAQADGPSERTPTPTKRCAVDTAVYASTPVSNLRPLRVRPTPAGALPSSASLSQSRSPDSGGSTSTSACSALTRALPVILLATPDSGGCTAHRIVVGCDDDGAASAPQCRIGADRRGGPRHAASMPAVCLDAAAALDGIQEVESGADDSAARKRPEARVTLRVTSFKGTSDSAPLPTVASPLGSSAGKLGELLGRSPLSRPVL